MTSSTLSLPAVSQFGAVSAGPASTDHFPFITLAVRSLEASVRFYQVLFDRLPVRADPDQALFSLDDPPLAVLLSPDEGAVARDGHVGIQLKYSSDVARIQERLVQSGYAIDMEETEASCCFSVANKVWVSDPDRNLWEVYVLIAENATEVRCGDSCACEAGGCG
ncbi:MAG: VOC family protein [Aquisalimonadaceae bacterium]